MKLKEARETRKKGRQTPSFTKSFGDIHQSIVYSFKYILLGRCRNFFFNQIIFLQRDYNQEGKERIINNCINQIIEKRVMNGTTSPSWEGREYLHPTRNTRKSSVENIVLALSCKMAGKHMWIKNSISKTCKHMHTHTISTKEKGRNWLDGSESF